MVVACSPSYLEAEAEEWLEPWRQRLQWAEIVPLYSSLGDREENKQKKIKKTEESKEEPTANIILKGEEKK